VRKLVGRAGTGSGEAFSLIGREILDDRLGDNLAGHE